MAPYDQPGREEGGECWRTRRPNLPWERDFRGWGLLFTVGELQGTITQRIKSRDLIRNPTDNITINYNYSMASLKSEVIEREGDII